MHADHARRVRQLEQKLERGWVTLEEILSALRPGDVLTHCYHGREEGVLAQGLVRPDSWTTHRGASDPRETRAG